MKGVVDPSGVATGVEAANSEDLSEVAAVAMTASDTRSHDADCGMVQDLRPHVSCRWLSSHALVNEPHRLRNAGFNVALKPKERLQFGGGQGRQNGSGMVQDAVLHSLSLLIGPFFWGIGPDRVMNFVGDLAKDIGFNVGAVGFDWVR
jgi:hypothetical protein